MCWSVHFLLQTLLQSLARARSADGARALALEDMDAVFV